MKKIFLGICTIVLLMSINGTETNTSKVFICNSEGSTKYHLIKNCRGLNTCKHTIIEVSVQDAYNKGKKTLCGWED